MSEEKRTKMKDIDKELSTILRKVVLFDEKDKLETELIANIKELFKESVPLDEQVSGEEYEPYFGWCDVNGCEGEGCSGGNAWRDTGYWTVCSKHADMYREGKQQPKMKKKAIDRENSRDKETGYLPNDAEAVV